MPVEVTSVANRWSLQGEFDHQRGSSVFWSLGWDLRGGQ